MCSSLLNLSNLVIAGENQRKQTSPYTPSLFMCSPTPLPLCLIRAPPTFFPASRRLYHSWRSREECIILATRGTGGNRRPELRASPKLLELSPVLLPGALVVRQAVPLDGSTGWDWGDRATGVGAGQTEAFRLPGKGKPDNRKQCCICMISARIFFVAVNLWCIVEGLTCCRFKGLKRSSKV